MFYEIAGGIDHSSSHKTKPESFNMFIESSQTPSGRVFRLLRSNSSYMTTSQSKFDPERTSIMPSLILVKPQGETDQTIYTNVYQYRPEALATIISRSLKHRDIKQVKYDNRSETENNESQAEKSDHQDKDDNVEYSSNLKSGERFHLNGFLNTLSLDLLENCEENFDRLVRPYQPSAHSISGRCTVWKDDNNLNVWSFIVHKRKIDTEAGGNNVSCEYDECVHVVGDYELEDIKTAFKILVERELKASETYPDSVRRTFGVVRYSIQKVGTQTYLGEAIRPSPEPEPQTLGNDEIVSILHDTYLYDKIFSHFEPARGDEHLRPPYKEMKCIDETTSRATAEESDSATLYSQEGGPLESAALYSLQTSTADPIPDGFTVIAPGLRTRGYVLPHPLFDGDSTLLPPTWFDPESETPDIGTTIPWNFAEGRLPAPGMFVTGEQRKRLQQQEDAAKQAELDKENRRREMENDALVVLGARALRID